MNTSSTSWSDVPDPSLAVCTIALDEEPFLEEWIANVRQVADHVILGVDSRSTDRTAEIARQHNVKVILFDWHDSFAAARNLTLDAVRGCDWVLVTDPDERLTPAGVEAIRRILDVADDVADDVDGFSPLTVETDLAGRVLHTVYSAGRLLRAVPDLRYLGRVHEEPRYLPDPPLTNFMHMEGGPHLQHLGGTPEVRARRAKDERDTRLLNLRLEDNSNDAVALFYLAQMARDAGRLDEGAAYARRALECGPEAVHPDRYSELEALTGARETIA